MAAQHRILVAQDQQLGVFGQITAEQYDQQAEHGTDDHVNEGEEHRAVVPGRTPRPQPNPQVRPPTEYTSGTGVGRRGGPACGPRPASAAPVELAGRFLSRVGTGRRARG